MRWGAVIVVAIAAALLPKWPGTFAHWHAWRGIQLRRRYWPRITLGWCTWHLLPRSSARRVADVLDELGRPRNGGPPPRPAPGTGRPAPAPTPNLLDQ